MTDAPFLFLSVRPEDEAADDEYAAVLRFSGLDEARLPRIRLTEEPLGEVDLDAWSGIVLGGGPYNVTDPAKSAEQVRTEADLNRLLAEVVPRDFPFLGCCYGIGTVGAYVGATIDRAYSEPVGATVVELTAAGREDPLFAGLPDRFEAFGGHKEAIRALPAHAVRLAGSTHCPVQAFRVGRNVYATQFHPELDVAGLCTRIDVYAGHGYFPPESAQSLKDDACRHDVVHPPTILRRFVERYARSL